MIEAAPLNKMLAQVGELDKFRIAVERAAENAREQTQSQLKKLNTLCATYWSGNEHRVEAFEAVNREAHVAAFLLLTYSQTIQSLGIVNDDVCEVITAAGHAMQLRAFFHEEMHLNNSLSPSALFYDDLYSSAMLEHKHVRAFLGFDLLTVEDVRETGAGANLSNDEVDMLFQPVDAHHD